MHHIEVNVDDEDKNVGHLEEAAIRRRQKIQELRNKRKLPGNNDDDPSMTTDHNSKGTIPTPKFRSYVPNDTNLQEGIMPASKPDNISDHIKDVLDIVPDNNSKALADDIDLTKLAPKKIDWDLKRNISKKLDKLERRTQIAIAELIRERIMGNSDKVQSLDKATEDLDAANRNIEVDDDDEF
ncbi:Coiled-coil domain-containing protein 12 [Blomia tropicalis]|nr:Coiled-coil domain-containing protein 12 [Blomia tropicalis]